MNLIGGYMKPYFILYFIIPVLLTSFFYRSDSDSNYLIDKKVYEYKNFYIEYPIIRGYEKKLIQNNVNQSFEFLISKYSDDLFYSNMNIYFEINKRNRNILSVVFRGKGRLKNKKYVEILDSVNFDMFKTGKVINYSNFIKDDLIVRKIILNRMYEQFGIDDLKTNNIEFYFKDDNIIFYFKLFDDFYKDYLEVSVPLSELSLHLDYDF
ncbi:MAG: hypothetical protein PWP28_1700 [Oceanotoga sp.]|nr:hypothetical protein [Oceanotoga sp.]